MTEQTEINKKMKMKIAMTKLDLIYDSIDNCHSLRSILSDLLSVPELTDKQILSAIDYWRKMGYLQLT